MSETKKWLYVKTWKKEGRGFVSQLKEGIQCKGATEEEAAERVAREFST